MLKMLAKTIVVKYNRDFAADGRMVLKITLLEVEQHAG